MTVTISPPAKEIAPPLGHHRNGSFYSIAQPETKALKLIANLCYALKHEQIAYCHWKSNTAIDKSASGENDLDLLIRREDVARFTALLHGLGFKQATLRPDKQLPGVLDFYGFDRKSGKLVHVHAHYQLILGHDGAKNYRIPIENAYISTSVQDEHFMVPLPEFELIIFVIRMILKHATWDAMLGFEGDFAKSEKSEWDDLTTRSDINHMYLLLEKHLPFLDRELFDRCIGAVNNSMPFRERAAIARELQKALQPHSRRPHASAMIVKMWRRGTWGIRKYVFRQPSRKRFAAGGTVIAFVGGDGAGKSTAVDAAYAMLSKTFSTHKVHMGKPPWSPSSFLVKVVLKAGRMLKIFASPQVSTEAIANGETPDFPGYPWLLWHVLTARDRLRLYTKVRRLSSNGDIVICDRFPLPQIKAMDGERTGWLAHNPQVGSLIQRLARLENKLYRHILAPDVLIIMRVAPEVAVQRRVDEDSGWVRARNQEIWLQDWSRTSAHVIDAGQSQEDVVREIKSLIWSQL